MTDAKLLPCPFCGKTPPHVHLSHVTGRIFCEGCGAEGPWSPYFNDGGWNTRTPHPAPVTAREAVPSALRYVPTVTTDNCRTPPQPSETVAEASRLLTEIVDQCDLMATGRTWRIDAIKRRAVAALRALKGGSDG